MLHDPNISPREDLNPEEYKNGKATTLNHFYEKLLKLKVRLPAILFKAMVLEYFIEKLLELRFDCHDFLIKTMALKHSAWQFSPKFWYQ